MTPAPIDFTGRGVLVRQGRGGAVDSGIPIGQVVALRAEPGGQGNVPAGMPVPPSGVRVFLATGATVMLPSDDPAGDASTLASRLGLAQADAVDGTGAHYVQTAAAVVWTVSPSGDPRPNRLLATIAGRAYAVGEFDTPAAASAAMRARLA
jgi:hypothetical protein